MSTSTAEAPRAMNAQSLADRLVQRCLQLTSQVLGRVIAEGEYLSHAAVHEIRVTTKQLRAAWRLVEHPVHEPAVTARARLRALHHLLASGRQRDVMRATLTQLLVKCRHKRDRALLQGLLDTLPATPGMLIGRATADNVGLSFRAESRAWRELAVHADEALLTTALVANYRHARRASIRVGQGRSLAAHHRLRQLLKRLLYQIDLVYEQPPAGIVPLLADMTVAAAELGALQDLRDLRDFVEASVDDEGVRRRATRLLARRLRKRCKRIAAPVAAAFAASPAQFSGALARAVPSR